MGGFHHGQLESLVLRASTAMRRGDVLEALALIQRAGGTTSIGPSSVLAGGVRVAITSLQGSPIVVDTLGGIPDTFLLALGHAARRVEGL